MEEPSGEFLRLHPLTLVHYMFLATVVALLSWLFSPESEAMKNSLLIFAGSYAILVAPYVIARYILFRYHATSHELVIYSGVFKRVRRSIPSDRIQNVAIERNILSRVLGTAAVRIETAGTASAEGVLSYVGIREAERLRNLFRTAQAIPIPEETVQGFPGFSMSLRRVVLASIYQFSFGLIALLIGLFFQLESFGIVKSQQVMGWLMEQSMFSGEIERTWPMLVAVLLPVTLALGWILGFIQNLVRFYRFRMELGLEKIHRKFGLLTIREGSLPYKRVQSFLIRSNPLMRLRRWYRLEMQTLGLQSGERGFQPAMPFAKWSEIMEMAPQIRPFTLPDTDTHVSRKTIRRHSLRYSMLIAIGVVILSLTWSMSALWGFALLPVAWGCARLQYLCHRWAFHDGSLFIRRRVFSQQFWIVPVERFQGFEITASFFQRRLGLCTLIVDTAGAGDFRYPRIIDMDREDARQLLSRLYEAFQAETAHSKTTV